MADGGECSNNGAARSSEASEAAEVGPTTTCGPITAEIMTDPVSTLDGFTYEREAITEWLRTKDTSPLTTREARWRARPSSRTSTSAAASSAASSRRNRGVIGMCRGSVLIAMCTAGGARAYYTSP
jgi:hypothetical protein